MTQKSLLAALATLPLLALFSGAASAAASFPDHRGDSPWSFTVIAEPSDTFVVNDADSGTIDQFLFRPQGPIVIDVPIRRYVAPTDGDGHLLNAADLVQRGVVGATASIQLPAFDVDQNTFPVVDCDGDDIDDQLMNEVDEVYLNDELLGKLQGDNNIWLAQSFTVPIEKLKFPSSPGGIAVNRFRIEIDVANEDVVLSSGAVGCIVWATAIDWIGVKFEASSPVILVHGIRSSGATFNNFKAGLESERITADNSITLTDPAQPDPLPAGCPDIPYNNSIAHNVNQLQTLIPQIAELYGTDSIHLATHSKGGLDSVGLMSRTLGNPLNVAVGRMSGQEVRRDLEFNSLVTLDTPHQGSVLAKYGVEARQLTTLQALRTGLDVPAAKLFEGAYYCDLTPERAAAFTAGASLPNGLQTAAVAADADQDGDAEIAGGEADGFPGGALAANRLYQLIGSTADVTITVTPVRFLPDRITVTTTPTAAFLPNDVIVTVDSADQYTRYPITGWHHLNVHSEANAQQIGEDAQTPGLVDWRLR